MIQSVTPFDIQKINGLKLLHIENTSFLTNIQILTRVGSCAEHPSQWGLAHILEHMFFKGSSKRPGGTSISRAANDIGGKMNAYTTYDHTAYYITVLNDRFEEGFDILADMYRNPLFPADEFKKELNPILSEYREREDDPDSFLVERALQMYLGEAYHPIIGTEETIRGATVEKMHDFKNRFYGGNNTLISVAGGVSQDRIESALKSAFPFSDETEDPEIKESTYTAGELTLTKPGISEAYFTLFYPALPPNHPERFKQDFMNYVLGGNDSGLLFERIREELGMSCYGIYSFAMRNDPHSVLGISCGIAPDELDQLESEVNTIVDRICTELVEEDRVNRARASIRTSIAARSETSTGLNTMMSVPILRGETEDPVQKALSEMEQVTLEDIREMAARTFSGPRFKAILLPENKDK
ncbi:MAG: pitrilysin family protein [Leptospiraceae bacterium]